MVDMTGVDWNQIYLLLNKLRPLIDLYKLTGVQVTY